eukprot:9100439-Pyramimonas_sp.AAC.1
MGIRGAGRRASPRGRALADARASGTPGGNASIFAATTAFAPVSGRQERRPNCPVDRGSRPPDRGVSPRLPRHGDGGDSSVPVPSEVHRAP